jgi:hypothetical protein
MRVIKVIEYVGGAIAAVGFCQIVSGIAMSDTAMMIQGVEAVFWPLMLVEAAVAIDKNLLEHKKTA